MASRIDPTIPADNAAAIKAEFRANFAAAKAEIEGLQAALANPPPTTPGGSLVLSVTAFGAKGDNVRDDTSSIQAAVNALPERGGIAFLPRGIYRTNGTITIPTVAGGVVKPVCFMGENAVAIDGTVTGWAAGASAINHFGQGACIDATGGPRAGPLSPSWAGSIRDLALHRSGVGSIGVHANALLSSQFYNVLVRGFPHNWRIEGEYFYALWINCLSLRGQFVAGTAASSGDGPKANGALFLNCQFSKVGGNVPAVVFGEHAWPGQFIKFSHCYFENNDVAISAKKASSLFLDQCYFEGNCQGTGLAEVFFEGLGGGYSECVLDRCYHRLTVKDRALVEVRAGNAANEVLVSILNNKISAEAAGQHAVLLSAGSPAKPSIIAMGNRTQRSSQKMPIYSAPVPGDLQNFNAIDCALTADKVGKRTVMAG